MIYSLLGFYLNWRAYNVFTEGHPRRWEVTLNILFLFKLAHNASFLSLKFKRVFCLERGIKV